MKSVLISLSFVFAVLFSRAQQIYFTGKVVESDSITIMPYVYIINKTTGNGAMSDEYGKFSLSAEEDDTLICSFVGRSKLLMPIKKLKN